MNTFIKRILVLIFVFLTILNCKLQAQYKSEAFNIVNSNIYSISVNELIEQNYAFHPFVEKEKISALSISADVNLKSDSSLIRVILVDNANNEYLVYETYPLLADSKDFTISNIGEESIELNNIIPTKIKFDIIDASILLKELHIAHESVSMQFLLKTKLAAQNSDKIDLINRISKKWVLSGLPEKRQFQK